MSEMYSENPDLFLFDVGFTVTLNPPWEMLVESFSVPAGGYAFIASQEIATQSVPEPTTSVMLVIGSVGALGLAWWRRKQTQ